MNKKQQGLSNPAYERQEDDEITNEETTGDDYWEVLSLSGISEVYSGENSNNIEGKSSHTKESRVEVEKKPTLLELSKQCTDLEHTAMLYNPTWVDANVDDVWVYGHRGFSGIEFFDITPKQHGFWMGGKNGVWLDPNPCCKGSH